MSDESPYADEPDEYNIKPTGPEFDKSFPTYDFSDNPSSPSEPKDPPA